MYYHQGYPNHMHGGMISAVLDETLGRAVQIYDTGIWGVTIYSADTETALSLPLVDAGISASFPSPAFDFVDKSIDLNKHPIKHPSATFYGRVKGDSLKNAGITDGDLLVIDKSLEPTNGKISVCYIDGEFTAKRIQISANEILLVPENEAYKPVLVEKENVFLIWGIVTHVIKKV